MNRFVLALILAGTASAKAPPPPCFTPSIGQHFQGVVTRVYDGDTMFLGCIKVRLGDFDAPEMSEADGPAAGNALRSIALGKSVDCIAGLGARHRGAVFSYGRIIATCTMPNGRTLGGVMRGMGIREGGR